MSESTTTEEVFESIEISSKIAQPWPFSSVRVDRRTAGGSIISWELQSGANVDIDHYDLYFIERAAGTIHFVKSTAGYLAVDSTERSFSALNEGGYAVKLTLADGSFYWSGASSIPASWNQRDYNFVNEVIRREEQVSQFSGKGGFVYLLHRKWSGTLCSECVDPHTKEVTNPHCLSCFGTKYEGGYYTPLRIKGLIEAFDRRLAGDADKESETMVIRISDAPFISHYDILVVPQIDKRIEVLHKEPQVVVKGYPVIYNVQGQVLEDSHIIYRKDVADTEDVEEYMLVVDGNV